VGVSRIPAWVEVLMSGVAHFMVVSAESPEDACAMAETYFDEGRISGEAKGCISEDNEVYDRAGLSEQYRTIEDVNKEVQSWIDSPPYQKEALQVMKRHLKEVLPNSIKLITEDNSSATTDDEWYQVQKYAGHMKQQRKLVRWDKFNVLEHEFFAMDFTEFGVTRIENSEGKLYVVEVITKF
jgi:hypothetical protein